MATTHTEMSERKRRLVKATAVAAAVLSMAACSKDSTKPAANGTGMTSQTVSSSAPGPDVHNQADVTFAQLGIPHHQQAIPMSDAILGKPGIDPRVVQLATQFKTDEGPEIQQMQAWLTQWGQPMPSMKPGTEMPGMLPDEDISGLQAAQGVDATKRFLTGMIACHAGTIAMAEDEIRDGHYPAAVALAHSISTREQQENVTMQSILDSL